MPAGVSGAHGALASSPPRNTGPKTIREELFASIARTITWSNAEDDIMKPEKNYYVKVTILIRRETEIGDQFFSLKEKLETSIGMPLRASQVLAYLLKNQMR